jgi:hypothetical protein
MSISKEQALQLFDEQIAKAEEKRRSATYENRYDDLYNLVVDGGESLISSHLGEDEAKKYRRNVHGIPSGDTGNRVLDMQIYDSHVGRCITQLQIYRRQIGTQWPDKSTTKSEPQQDTVATLKRIARRLPEVIHQLGHRYSNRDTLTIRDEYDLQDLIHALLYLFFEDIRPEEGTPSLAGVNARMDFLLYNERIVVEIKKTRAGLRNKELKEQLSIDIPHYSRHPNCETLVGIVYDPARLISNPKGVERDLSIPYNDMSVHIFIIQS